MCERLTNALPGGVTNVLQWNVSLVGLVTYSSWFPGEPAYRQRETPALMTVRSGHQGILRLVDYVTTKGEPSRGQSGVELRIFLEPMEHAPIRTDPFEVEGANYVAGHGPGWTEDAALKAIKQWPADQ